MNHQVNVSTAKCQPFAIKFIVCAPELPVLMLLGGYNRGEGKKTALKNGAEAPFFVLHQQT